MAEDFGGQLGQMWRSVYAQARQIADEQIKAALGNIVRGGKVVLYTARRPADDWITDRLRSERAT